MRATQPWRTSRSRTLRGKATSAEAKLWNALRNRQLSGYKFVRQTPIGPYFVDFLCRERKVVVEADGATHGSDAELAADAARQRDLERLGYRLFRTTNAAIFENLEGVLDALLNFMDEPAA